MLTTTMLETTGPDWRDGFLFVGDQLAIDFVNTRVAADGEPLELLTAWEAVVRWFRAAGLVDAAAGRRLCIDWDGTPEARRAIRTLTAFRESVRATVTRLERGRPATSAFVRQVNRHLRAQPLRTQLTSDGRRLRRVSTFDTSRPERLIAPLAEAAASLLVDADPNRVRRCEACAAHFYDASKNGLRRWCSMRICGNRAKVARYAARQRAEDQIHDAAGL